MEYLQFAFRWMNNLLMRELPLRCTIRLWDTYQVWREPVLSDYPWWASLLRSVRAESLSVHFQLSLLQSSEIFSAPSANIYSAT